MTAMEGVSGGRATGAPAAAPGVAGRAASSALNVIGDEVSSVLRNWFQTGRDLFWLSPSLGFLTHRKFLTYFPCSHTSTSPNLAQNERTGPCLEAPPNLRDHCYTRFSGSLHTFFL